MLGVGDYVCGGILGFLPNRVVRVIQANEDALVIVDNFVLFMGAAGLAVRSYEGERRRSLIVVGVIGSAMTTPSDYPGHYSDPPR